ncbi:hypothetical protein DC429_14815 [Arthrobacter sp. TPD3018]|nr:hypothetical protein DC425_15435 [Sphingomonas sp. TPD3009]PVE53699.1 hypothetical protein DC429_14815 [Arthrobacter sp. TPD3018]PVE78849.1 hypothetical protein DC431_18100 [Sphingomonas melonis]
MTLDHVGFIVDYNEDWVCGVRDHVAHGKQIGMRQPPVELHGDHDTARFFALRCLGGDQEQMMVCEHRESFGKFLGFLDRKLNDAASSVARIVSGAGKCWRPNSCVSKQMSTDVYAYFDQHSVIGNGIHGLAKMDSGRVGTD